MASSEKHRLFSLFLIVRCKSRTAFSCFFLMILVADARRPLRLEVIGSHVYESCTRPPLGAIGGTAVLFRMTLAIELFEKPVKTRFWLLREPVLVWNFSNFFKLLAFCLTVATPCLRGASQPNQVNRFQTHHPPSLSHGSDRPSCLLLGTTPPWRGGVFTIPLPLNILDPFFYKFILVQRTGLE